MNPSYEERLASLLHEAMEEQRKAPNRERAVFITDLEKLLAWCQYINR